MHSPHILHHISAWFWNLGPQTTLGFQLFDSLPGHSIYGLRGAFTAKTLHWGQPTLQRLHIQCTHIYIFMINLDLDQKFTHSKTNSDNRLWEPEI